MPHEKEVNFSISYFINKFSSIPYNRWCVGDLLNGDQCCAAGHCGITEEGDCYTNPEFISLSNLFKALPMDLNRPQLGNYFRVSNVNDGTHPKYASIKHPKDRILQALYDLKDGLLKESELLINRIEVSIPKFIGKTGIVDDILSEEIQTELALA